MTSEWARWRLKSPASRFLTQPFIRAQIKVNIKALRHWHLCGEFIGTSEFPAQMASNAENVSIWWRHHGNQCAAVWLMPIRFWRMGHGRMISILATAVGGEGCPCWHHQMETVSVLLALCEGNRRWPVDSPHKGPVMRAFMFSLMFVQTNVQTNRRDAGDLRRHRAHNDVAVMSLKFWGHGFESKLQPMTKRYLPCCQYTGTLFSCVLHTKWYSHALVRFKQPDWRTPIFRQNIVFR